MSWQIPFMTLSGKEMRIVIAGDADSSDITLTGASQPFSVDVDDDDDLFMPVRTMTGNINVVGTFDDVKDIVTSDVPTNRSATLLLKGEGEGSSTNWTALWRGFVRCESFDCDWSPFKQEIQLPVLSLLAMLDNIPMEKTLGLTSFCSFINEIQSKLNHFWTYIYMPAGFLNILFNRSNYLTERDQADADGSMYDSSSYLEILQDLCNYFGWQCQEDADSIYFLSQDNTTTYRKYLMSEFIDSTSNVLADYTTVTRQQLTLPEIVSDDNTVSVIPGRKSIEVEGDVNEFSESLYSFKPEDDLEYSGTNESYVWSSDKRYVSRKFKSQTGAEISAVQLQKGTTTQVAVNNIKYYNAVYGDTYEGASICCEAIIGEDYESALQERIVFLNSTSDNHTTPLVTIKPWRMAYHDTDGYIKISVAQVIYATKSYAQFEDGFTGKLRCRIMQGTSHWWHEEDGWQDTETVCNLVFKDGKLKTSSYQPYYGEEEGFFVGWGGYDVDNEDSYITLEILAAYKSDGTTLVTDYLAISGLSIQIYYSTVWTYGVDNKNTYKKDINTGYPDELSVKCGLTYAKTGQVGKGVVKSKPFYTRPEIYLGERMATYYSKSHAMYSIVCRGTQLLSPLNTMKVGDDDCAIIAQSYDPRYEELKLTLLAL